MADQIAIVNFDTPGIVTNRDVTSSAITDTVQAVILLWNYQTTDGTTDDHGIHGMSFVADDGTQQSAELTTAIMHRALDGRVSSADICDNFKFASGGHALIACPIISAATAVIELRCNYVSMIAGGFRYASTVATLGVTAKCTAIIFAGISRAYSSLVAPSTTLASENVGVAGNRFQPDFLITSGHDGGFSDPTRSAVLTFNTGFVDSASGQVGSGAGWASASPTDSDGEVSTVAIPAPSSTRAQGRVTIALTSTGFNHQLTTGAAFTPDLMYMAIKFAGKQRIKAANFAIPASTGELSLATGFPVNFAIGQTSLYSATDTFTDGAEASGVGRFVWTPTAARAFSICQKENVTLGTTDTAMRQDSLAALTLDQNKAVAHSAVFTRNTSSGPVLTFSTANVGYISGLFIGPFEGDETVTITETSSLVTSAFQANETVAISEGIVYASTTIFGEVVNISDGFLLLPTNLVQVVADRRGGTAQAGAAKGETVEASVDAGMTAG